MAENENKIEAEAYKAPHLEDYGPVSELTDTISGDTGDDGGYPSYTASVF
ncbi:MAG: hypothetical protein ABJF89_11380 [Parasphingorhabdus sp.]